MTVESAITITPRRPLEDDEIVEAWQRGRMRAYERGTPQDLASLQHSRRTLASWLRSPVIDQDVATFMLISSVELTHRLDLYLNDHLEDNRATAIRVAAEEAVHQLLRFLKDNLPACTVNEETTQRIDA